MCQLGARSGSSHMTTTSTQQKAVTLRTEEASTRSRRREIVWYEDVSPKPVRGDANRDGEFNQLDIVQVLQGAKFFHGESATWEDGNWYGDGVFDQLDIVAALATGNYMQGPYVAE